MKVSLRKFHVHWIVLLPLAAVAVGFFIPDSRWGLWGFIIKGILFLLVLWVFYIYIIVPRRKLFPIKETDQVTEESSLEMIPEEMLLDQQWTDFGDAFRWYYQEFLTVLRTALVASCAGLYMRRGREGLEFQAGESDQGRVVQPMFVAEGSLVDYVIRQKAPILEGNLPIGTILSGLGGIEIRSFIGVPLILDNEAVGVLALGGEATESFGEDDQTFAVRCGRLLTQVMAVYHRGLRWEMDQEVYRIHLELGKALKDVTDEESAVFDFVQHIKQLFPFDRFTFCTREGTEGLIRHVYGQIDDVDRGVRFSLDEGLNGWILKRNAPLLIADMKEGDYQRPRYTLKEDTRHGFRSFLGISLGRGKSAWGCFSIESSAIGQYSEKSKEVLTALAVHLESTLERIHLMKQVRELGKNGISSQPAQFQME